MTKKRVLIACEYSGIVRKEFSLLGWDAYSCDVLETETPTQNNGGWGQHIKGCVLTVLHQKWDLLIGFPPCTFLTYAGTRNWEDLGREELRKKAAVFFMLLYDAPIQYICIENPQGIMSQIFRKPNMVIHPYYFGCPEMKRTCLWLKNLPNLDYRLTNTLFGERTSTDKPKPLGSYIVKKTGKVKKTYFCDTIIKGKIKTSKERSKTFVSIAKAMAKQWTIFIENN